MVGPCESVGLVIIGRINNPIRLKSMNSSGAKSRVICCLLSCYYKGATWSLDFEKVVGGYRQMILRRRDDEVAELLSNLFFSTARAGHHNTCRV
jgi:hypothetical protein